MPAFIYLGLMVALGDAICRAFLPPLSHVHRVSSAFLVGLVVSSWITYLAALLLTGTDGPMLLANLAFAAIAIVAIVLLRRRGHPAPTQPVGSELVDVVLLCAALLGTTLLMTATFDVREGSFLIGNTVFSDFGPTTAIMQSFALGQNLPTEYPHFAGAPIRYHFLFFFQAGNIQFLGLDPALSLNLLSSASIVAMLAQLIALGRLLFGSNVPGQIGAVLFYAHGTLAWVPWAASHGSISEAVGAVASRREFLPSGFPWRGEEWGVWTLTIFANQRHLASAIGLLLVVLVFVVARHRGTMVPPDADTPDDTPPPTDEPLSAPDGRLAWRRHLRTWALDPWMPGFLVAGLLLGALPLWNGAVFVAAFFVMAVLTIALPRRHLMVVMAMAAAVVALPQLDFLRPYTGTHAGYPAFYWGYVIDQATPPNVLRYLVFTFGIKVALAAAALPFIDGLARRVLLAATSLLIVAFTVQLSVEVFANHKFINIWLVVLNLFAGYAIWMAWERAGRGWVVARAIGVAALAVIAIGGLIDLMPFKNGNQVQIPYDREALSEWVQESTDPRDMFLTDIVVTNQILLNGRFVYLGWPYYAWSAGYPTDERESLYRQMYAPGDAAELLRLLQAEGIDYVVWDEGIRTRGFVEQPNEEPYRRSFPVAFSDGVVVIYQVAAPVAGDR